MAIPNYETLTWPTGLVASYVWVLVLFQLYYQLHVTSPSLLACLLNRTCRCVCKYLNSLIVGESIQHCQNFTNAALSSVSPDDLQLLRLSVEVYLESE